MLNFVYCLRALYMGLLKKSIAIMTSIAHVFRGTLCVLNACVDSSRFPGNAGSAFAWGYTS